MNNLQLIEEGGLIKVYETDKGEKVVNARELHKGLQNKRQFADWIKQRLNEVDGIENNDFISFSQKSEKGGRPVIEYILKLDTAKEMAMLERNEKGKEYRRYFLEIEKKYKARTSPTCIEDVMIQSLQEMKAIKYELAAAKEIATTAQEGISNIKDTIITDLENWRDDVNKTIKKIGAKLGDYRRAWRESYEHLEKRARCNLDRRLQNYTKRLIENGAPKRKVNEACYLDVIDHSERLRQIYIGVVKEMSIRYLD